MSICGGPLLKISRGFRIFIWTSPAVKRCRKMTILFLFLSSQASSTTLSHTLFLSLALSFSLSLALSLFSSLSLSHTHTHTPTLTHTHTHTHTHTNSKTISPKLFRGCFSFLETKRNECNRSKEDAQAENIWLEWNFFAKERIGYRWS